MSSCPACQGIPEIQPCRGYCINVMKGCLAFHAQLSDSWNEFIGKCVFKVQTKTHFSKKKNIQLDSKLQNYWDQGLGLETFVAICFMTFDKRDPRLNGLGFFQILFQEGVFSLLVFLLPPQFRILCIPQIDNEIVGQEDFCKVF